MQIFSPHTFYDLPYPIVVCSALFSKDIVEEIKQMNISNKIIIA